MIGKKFKSLTIISLDEEKNNKFKEERKKGLRKNTPTYYICKCDCGNILSLEKSKIQRRKEFGCKKCKYINFNEYINKKINHWTILNFIKEERKFYCQCDCGTKKKVDCYNLINNQSKDCGCGRKQILSNMHCTESLIGKTYGRLTVIEERIDKEKKRTVCKCICECGNEVDVLSNSLKTNHTISCGCVKSQMPFEIKKYLNLLGYNVQMEKRINLINKEISYMYFDLFVEELNLAIEYDGKCHFEPIDWASKGEEWAIENLRYTQFRDKIKNEYCYSNGITLLRIPYTQKDIYKEIINETIAMILI